MSLPGMRDRRSQTPGMERRALLTVLAAGTIAVLSSCGEDPKTASDGKAAGRAQAAAGDGPAAAKATSTLTDDAPPGLPPIPKANPGKPEVIFSAPAPTKNIALTVDDGFNKETVQGYVDFAQRTGIPLTLNPNGCYQHIWNKHAAALAPLIESGQVMIGNHTYNHLDMRGDPTRTRNDIEKNEDWIQKTFKITSRPYCRPPFGYRNAGTDQLAADLGYTKILMWDGDFGDWHSISPDALMTQARKWLHAGGIMLGHANYPTILGLFDQIQQLIAERGLKPVTLDTMFGTSRATG